MDPQQTQQEKEAAVSSEGEQRQRQHLLAVYAEQIVPSVVSAVASHGHDNVWLVCGDGGQVHTSALLLAFLSPWLGELLKDSLKDAGEAELCLILPHVQAGRVRAVLDSVLSREEQVDGAEIREIFSPFCTGGLNNSSINGITSLYAGQHSAFLPFPAKVEINDNDHYVKHEPVCEVDLGVLPIKIKLGTSEHSNASIGRKRKLKRQSILIKEIFSPSCSEGLNNSTDIGISSLCAGEDDAFLPFPQAIVTVSDPYSEEAYSRHNTQHKQIHAIETVACDCEPDWKTNTDKNFHLKCVHMGHFGCELCYRTFLFEEVFKSHMELNHSVANEYGTVVDIPAHTHISVKTNLAVGETFASKEEAQNQVQQFSDSNFSPLVIQSSGRGRNRTQRMSYKCPYGIMRKSESTGKRQITHKYVGCPVILNINQQANGAFVVRKAELEHKEHDVGEEAYAGYNKKLSKDQEEAVNAFLVTEPSNREVSMFLNDLTSKRYSTRDAAFIVRKLKIKYSKTST
eukprot:GFUD01026386.1.p1 GENE.GFUD01026386.1~~GFUD01026386.1.p1  ORF type:complete len:513 (-),score=113.10 GFUD01026386.1:18-1556(-)